MTENPDEIVVARPVRCTHCQAALGEADHVLHGRYDKIDLPAVAPVVTRVERYAGRYRCCGATTLAPVPEGLEPGTPFSVGIVALAMYLRFVHAISDQRLSRLLGELFGLGISEGALDRPRCCVAAIARLRQHLWFERIATSAGGADMTQSLPPAMRSIIEAAFCAQ